MTDDASTWFALDVLFVSAVVLFAIGFAMRRAYRGQPDAGASRRRRRAIASSPVRLPDRKNTNARS